MHIAQHHMGPVQNMGWFDRIARVIVGAALILAVLYEMQKGVPIGGYAYLPILAIYPLMTGILGWDPLYAAGHIKSCDMSDDSHNKCGTFLFEVESAMGKDMKCNDGYDCSIAGNEKEHHKKEE
ncbi:DUF2892 domain-containing protein [Pseudomonadota bacterium]